MMHRWILILMALFSTSLIHAQEYTDYIGAGHYQGMTVHSSNDFQPPGRDQQAHIANTINGRGLDGPRQAAARFLSQASFGGSALDIDRVMDMGFENWIDDQISIHGPSMMETMTAITREAYELYLRDPENNPDDFYGPAWNHFQYAFWQNNIQNEDLLRQRVAWALSQIMVISIRSDLDGRGEALATYYDILLNNALGNYEDLLYQVTLSPAMGFYLSHYNNPKADPEKNIHPDENYAREVMQLFSIGLYMLNNDGTHKKDGAGQDIPTYDNSDITEMARVFTGLGPGGIKETTDWLTEPYFGLEPYWNDYTVPMVMYEEYHDTDAKNLINGTTLPAGQSGMEDVRQAIHHLAMHPNVGPFLARRLIQNLVKSNPSPEYIDRVASVFNNNGSGERGDLGAVVKAILLDPEARTCAWIQDEYQGKLREPFQRYMQVVRSMDLLNINGKYWNIGYQFAETTGQIPLASNSVFNFFLPDYQPQSFKKKGDLYGPEFQIHNSKTSIGIINQFYQWALRWNLLNSWEEIEPTYLDYVTCEPLAKDPEILLNKLDILFTHGQMTDGNRKIIREAMESLRPGNMGADFLEYRVATALYLTLINPDFAILK
ncbi:DUF1800 domain-containing protein [Membranicola marinus]|uniref:DUF1800 domain-containing protein n=1 Tax=Membranihabitans marinus TaxID=1227546 RepID=A0A953HVE8_9BACT|nr:DUF1800 family protein [Membranihabitans marinus]MBY5958975.1 DUF1800 domain-containing protein [Membranihabitans marinus]